jgi:hypothetical protein
MLRHVALVRTYVSEELSSSFIGVTRIGGLGTTLTVTSNRRTLRRNTVECRAVAEIFGKGNRSTRRNPAPLQLCQTQLPRDLIGPPLWSSCYSSWLQIQKFWVRFLELTDFLSSSWYRTGSTQLREDDWGSNWMKNSRYDKETRD